METDSHWDGEHDRTALEPVDAQFRKTLETSSTELTAPDSREAAIGPTTIRLCDSPKHLSKVLLIEIELPRQLTEIQAPWHETKEPDSIET